MNWIVDTAERTAATYLQALIGLLVAGWADAIDVSTLRAASVAAIPAGLAVLKAALARRVGDPDTAGLTAARGPECPGATWDGWPQ